MGKQNKNKKEKKAPLKKAAAVFIEAELWQKIVFIIAIVICIGIGVFAFGELKEYRQKRAKYNDILQQKDALITEITELDSVLEGDGDKYDDYVRQKAREQGYGQAGETWHFDDAYGD